MMKKNRLGFTLGLLIICCLMLVGCGKTATNKPTQKKKPELTGIYQIDKKYRDKDDQGRVQSNYVRFTKNGKVEMAEPETGDDDSGYYGTAYRGTWKYLKDKKFKVHIKSVYDSDEFDITFVKDSKNKIHSLKNHSGSFYWDADSWTRDTSMTGSDFELLFSKALSSSQEKVKEQGNDKPDKDSSDSGDSSDTSSSNDSNVSEKQIAVMVYQLCYPGDDISQESELGIYSNDGQQFIGNGGPVSNVRFSINGDTVTYAKKSQGSYDDEQTISVKDLVKKCYSTYSQKTVVDSAASSLSSN